MLAPRTHYKVTKSMVLYIRDEMTVDKLKTQLSENMHAAVNLVNDYYAIEREITDSTYTDTEFNLCVNTNALSTKIMMRSINIPITDESGLLKSYSAFKSRIYMTKIYPTGNVYSVVRFMTKSEYSMLEESDLKMMHQTEVNDLPIKLIRTDYSNSYQFIVFYTFLFDNGLADDMSFETLLKLCKYIAKNVLTISDVMIYDYSSSLEFSSSLFLIMAIFTRKDLREPEELSKLIIDICRNFQNHKMTLGVLKTLYRSFIMKR